jgi:hypothetical protein
MLQVFHLDVAKVDLVLHMLQWNYLPQPPAAVAGGAAERAQHVLACMRMESVRGTSGLRML